MVCLNSLQLMTNLFLKEGILKEIVTFIFMPDKVRVFHDCLIYIFYLYIQIQL